MTGTGIKSKIRSNPNLNPFIRIQKIVRYFFLVDVKEKYDNNNNIIIIFFHFS
eukprot:CAMPEP_0203694992 /NCGR_PEP_ID=MMETSP0091-20130426/6570_1 /ASSEMBLY_ACC=CAM_ASM_001089 /TAXON_ID=426623 /ORGANISM="Chaetoceros affinis, Strain CCMP159" /LENGTH=52 /DNA_ID=CAMNT_0050566449 /DNA_START=136 /DNA_END=290 /DNA_ORIENTATION=+